MEIHGCDICVKWETVPLNPSLVEILIEDHWPNMVTELDSALPDQVWLFVYKDANAKKAWDEDIPDDCGGTDMISVIWDKDNLNEVWFVVDDNKINKYIVDDIQQFIRKCENGDAE